MKDLSLETNSKPKWASKTLWFNGLTTAGTAVAALVGAVPGTWTVYLMALQGAINFGLRLITSRPLE